MHTTDMTLTPAVWTLHSSGPLPHTRTPQYEREISPAFEGQTEQRTKNRNSPREISTPPFFTIVLETRKKEWVSWTAPVLSHIRKAKAKETEWIQASLISWLDRNVNSGWLCIILWLSFFIYMFLFNVYFSLSFLLLLWLLPLHANWRVVSWFKKREIWV